MKKNVEISKEGIIEEIQNRGLQGYPVFLACVVLTILSIVFQRKKLLDSNCDMGNRICLYFILFFD